MAVGAIEFSGEKDLPFLRADGCRVARLYIFKPKNPNFGTFLRLWNDIFFHTFESLG
jgi:hypothetical protein